MPLTSSHAPGSFAWVELATCDQADAKRFYGELFAWTCDDLPMGPDSTFTMFRRNGHTAAACYTLLPPMVQRHVPPHWMIYIAVENVDFSVRRAQELGGALMHGPQDVPEAGRMAFLADSAGTPFALWQARRSPGFNIEGEPGAFCRADLITPDPERCRVFYEALLGWRICTAAGDTSGYLHIQTGERHIAGIPPAGMAGGPPRWLAWFQVQDCDDSVARALALGATVRRPLASLERVGRLAVLADPQGAGFGLISPQRA